jgi:hypothetical protein
MSQLLNYLWLVEAEVAAVAHHSNVVVAVEVV